MSGLISNTEDANNNHLNPPSTQSYGKFLPFFIVGLASCFYLYDFFLRVMPGTMTQDLMRIFNIDAGGLGLLSSLFFYAYMIMQIPSGLLYDRFGPRRLITIFTVVSALSTLAFISTSSFTLAAIARTAMGFGAAFAYVGALILVSRWFSSRYYAFSAGVIQLMGSVGAIAGEAPLSRFIESLGPQEALIWIAVVGFVLAILFWFFIRDYPPGTGHVHTQHQAMGEWTRLKEVAKKRQSWAVACYGMTCWAPISVFAALWGVPFLMGMFHISNTKAAGMMSATWIGIAIGGPILGWFSNYIGRRKVSLYIAAISGLISALGILYLHHVSTPLMYVFLFFLGVAGSAQAVTFGSVQDNNHPRVAGTAAGFNNMSIVIGGAVLQGLVGKFLDWGWTGQIANGVHVYSLADYRLALLVLPICYSVAILALVFLIRETHCKAQYK